MYNNKKIFLTIKLFAEATIIIQHMLEWPVLYYYYYYTHIDARNSENVWK